jgi:serine protease Do
MSVKTAQKLSDYVQQIMSSSVMIESYMDSNAGDIGAGFFVAPRVVVTCAHVVGLTPQQPNPSIKSIIVSVKDTGKYYAQVIDFDLNLDVCFLYVNAPSQVNTYFLNLGNSGTLKEGEAVVSVGSPLGYNNSVSYGIVSNTNMSPEGQQDNNYFLLDLRTNPGNSGGLIYSLDKQAVVGIAVAVLNSKNAASEGISVGIAIDPVKKLLKKNRIRFVYNEQHSN